MSNTYLPYHCSFYNYLAYTQSMTWHVWAGRMCRNNKCKCKVIFLMFDTSKFKSVLIHWMAQDSEVHSLSWSPGPGWDQFIVFLGRKLYLSTVLFCTRMLKCVFSKLNTGRGVVTLWWACIPFSEGLGLKNCLSLPALQTRNTLLRPSRVKHRFHC